MWNKRNMVEYHVLHLVYGLLQTRHKTASRFAFSLHRISGCVGANCSRQAYILPPMSCRTWEAKCIQGALDTCVNFDSSLELLSAVCFLCSLSMSFFMDSTKSTLQFERSSTA